VQEALVIVIVTACAGWLGWQGFRYLKPKPGGKACAGGCCDGEEKPVASARPATASGAPTLMISSDDLRARIAARKG
jgi:hypothetical protein